jgi:glycosyltransferase involved in cell wall biosynthesis
MNNSELKISVVMPAYNAGKYIREAINSVLAQTFSDFELLIINDGSTDNTLEVIASFSDPRIILINQEVNKGIAAALNTGLLHAKTEYIARFDADDVCFPERLAIQFDFLETHPDYILTGSDAEYVSESGEHLFHFKCISHTNDHILKKINNYCPFIHSSVMYRKDAVLRAGGYSLYAHNFEDYFLWVRLHKYGRFYNLQKPLIKVRFNPYSSTIDEKIRGRHFRKLKREIILRGVITKQEGDTLYNIIKSQDTKKIKESSYYSLCGKKYLVNNHQPKKARASLLKAIRIYPLRIDNYGLYLLSYFPASFISRVHKMLLPKFANT